MSRAVTRLIEAFASAIPTWIPETTTPLRRVILGYSDQDPLWPLVRAEDVTQEAERLLVGYGDRPHPRFGQLNSPIYEPTPADLQGFLELMYAASAEEAGVGTVADIAATLDCRPRAFGVVADDFVVYASDAEGENAETDFGRPPPR